MKVLVVGSCRFNKEKKVEIDHAGREIGRVLAERGYTILVGADDPNDVDPSVVAGAIENSKNKAEIQVNVPHGQPIPFPEEAKNQGINLEIVWHQFPDWDVTVQEVIKNIDAVIAIGGRVGVIQAGISAWMMGVPVIPIGSLGGGGFTLWQYGSSRRAEFYHRGLDDVEIDKLASPWDDSMSAEDVVNMLEKVIKASNLAKTPRQLLFTALAITVISLLAWIFLLTFPSTFGDGKTTGNLLFMFGTVSASGLLGATIQTLRSIRSGAVVTGKRIIIDTVLGVAAGVISAILYLLAQVAVSGSVTFTMEHDDYIRVTLIVSMISLFASQYLDAALARFDKLKDSVIKGQFDGTN